MADEWSVARVLDLINVTDYVANGSFESLRKNVTYRSDPDYAVLVRLADHSAGWRGNFVYVDKPSYEFLRKSSLEPGDVIIANVGANAGNVFRVPKLDKPMTLGPNAVLCRPKDEENLQRDFLYYYLISESGQRSLQSILSGSAQPKFNKTDLRNLTIPLPSSDEQHFISTILSALDDKIELNRQMNETSEAIARALFKSWFVDFDPVRAKSEGRDYSLPKHIADLFPDSFEDSELGEIPSGWKVGELGEFIDTVKGCSYKSEELQDSDTALVTLKSFSRGGGYRKNGLKSFSGAYRPQQVVKPGEIVVACTDVTQAAEVIGRTAVVGQSSSYRTLIASLDTLIVRPISTRISRALLYYLGRTEAFVAHTYAHTTGTTVLHLAKHAVPSFRFVLPTAPIVEKFSAFAEITLNGQQAAENEVTTLVALRNALLPKLISGEIRVKDAERFVAARV